MAYSIYITRRELSADDADAIPLDEWEALAEALPCILFPPVLAADGTVLFDTSAPGDVVLRLPDGGICPLCWADGNIVAESPSAPVIARMHALATALRAQVRGEEDELYGADGKMLEREPPRRGFLSRRMTRD